LIDADGSNLKKVLTEPLVDFYGKPAWLR